MSSEEDISIGDIVAVNYGDYGRKEGLVIDTSLDYAGRQMVVVRLDPGEVYKTYIPNVRRVRRTISYSTPQSPLKQRTIERTIYW